MTVKIEHGPEKINRETFSTGQVSAMHTIHLTGGVRAAGSAAGWSVTPVRHGMQTGSIRPVPRTTLDKIAQEAGLRIIGGDQTTDFDTPLPSRIWQPLYGQEAGRQSAADEWGAISTAARRAGDIRVADLARSISITLKAAGIRIRDASDCYNRQLMGALHAGKKVGARFKNVPLADLYLAFHSLLTEMASARDYLSAFAGHRVGAPIGKDSLARLKDWVSAPGRAAEAADPLVATLLGASGAGATNGWLKKLGDYRNMFLHRKPMEMASGAFLVLKETAVQHFSVPTIELAIPVAEGSSQVVDALTGFIELNENLLKLAAFAADHADYSTTPPAFVVSRSNVAATVQD